MSTRGVYGFRKGTETKSIYHHYDSYPEALGVNFAAFIKRNAPEMIERLYANLNEVDPGQEPSDKQVEHCIDNGWCNLSVSDRSTKDWDCLLYHLQDLDVLQDALDKDVELYFENQTSFIKDSLFCEYAYLYNLDTKTLEFYVGFQKQPQRGNPFGTEPYVSAMDLYYPCKLVAEIPVLELTPEEIVEIYAKGKNAG